MPLDTPSMIEVSFAHDKDKNAEPVRDIVAKGMKTWENIWDGKRAM